MLHSMWRARRARGNNLLDAQGSRPNAFSNRHGQVLIFLRFDLRAGL